MTLLQTWLDYVGEGGAPDGAQEPSRSQSATSSPARRAYFISTSLDIHEADETQALISDIHLQGMCYRFLDPAYYAWLRRGMESAKRRHDKGALSLESWDLLRNRFNRMQAWAIDRYGKKALTEAVRAFRPAAYKPPVNRPSSPQSTTTPTTPSALRFRFPVSGDLRFEHSVTAEAVATVDAIREQAQALGWSEARLYQNRGRFVFPCGQDWGLVCFIGPKDALGQITETHIEIVHDWNGARNTLRFANADVWPPRIPKETVAV